jgi:DTW domain-containing protein YfiP
MLRGLCVCSLFPSPPLETRTRVVLFIHRIEDRKPTNSGRLATTCLANSEVVVRGHASTPTTHFVPPPGTRPLLLFPHEDAVPLADVDVSGPPVTLVVPDGSWRQASKVRNRVPGMKDLQCVFLPREADSRYQLRREAHDTGMATMEAIARALGILEGSAVRETLERVFLAMVERTLVSRGTLGASEVETPLSDDFRPDDFRIVRRV